MRDKVEDILGSFKLKQDQRKLYTAVKAKLELFFVKKKYIIYKQARFNCRIQEEGESVSSFITDYTA